MARPRKDDKEQITLKGKSYLFKGYAPDISRAIQKVGKNFYRAAIINTGHGSEVAIYLTGEWEHEKTDTNRTDETTDKSHHHNEGCPFTCLLRGYGMRSHMPVTYRSTGQRTLSLAKNLSDNWSYGSRDNERRSGENSIIPQIRALDKMCICTWILRRLQIPNRVFYGTPPSTKTKKRCGARWWNYICSCRN